MNILNPFVGNYCSAKSASDDIDINAIFSGCDEVDSLIESLGKYGSDFYDAGSKLNERVLSVDGATMVGSIEDCCNNIGDAQSGVLSVTSQIREAAVAAYNDLQQKYNDYAMAEEERRASRNG